MKKTNLLLMLVVCTLTMCLSVACKTDKEDLNEEIVGKWQGTVTYDDGDKESCLYVFTAAGTFSSKWWSGGIDDYDPEDFGFTEGTYHYDSDLEILRMKGVDEDGDFFEDYWECTITGNRMIWTGDMWDGYMRLQRI